MLKALLTFELDFELSDTMRMQVLEMAGLTVIA